MNLLTFDHLLSLLAPYANKETLSLHDASNIQLIITEAVTDYYVDFPMLKFLSRFLTQQAYEEIIEERNIEHLCGYIICNSSPKQQVRRRLSAPNGTITDIQSVTKFQIYNRKPSIILPNTYLSQYCCKDHYQASIFYRNQISNEALFSRKDILSAQPFPKNYPSTWYENGITCLEEVLAKHKEVKEQGKTLRDVISMLNGLRVGDEDNSKETNELVQLLNDFEIVEKDGGLVGDEEENDVRVSKSTNSLFLEEDDIDDDDDHEDDETEGDRFGSSNRTTAATSTSSSSSTQDKSRSIEGYITTDKYFGGYVV